MKTSNPISTKEATHHILPSSSDLVIMDFEPV